MSEATGHIPTSASSQPYLHAFETPDDFFEDPNKPEVTVVHERDRFGEVLTPTISDEMALQMAFGDFEEKANQLQGPYHVAGCKLFEEGGVYRIEITKQCGGDGFDNERTSTLIDIELDAYGRPSCTTDGPSLEADFKMRLDRLIERTIANAELI